MSETMRSFTDRPCAAAGLTSYRYAGRYGWIMIGASNDRDALTEAARSTGARADLARLERWDLMTGRYCPVIE